MFCASFLGRVLAVATEEVKLHVHIRVCAQYHCVDLPVRPLCMPIHTPFLSRGQGASAAPTTAPWDTNPPEQHCSGVGLSASPREGPQTTSIFPGDWAFPSENPVQATPTPFGFFFSHTPVVVVAVETWGAGV